MELVQQYITSSRGFIVGESDLVHIHEDQHSFGGGYGE